MEDCMTKEELEKRLSDHVIGAKVNSRDGFNFGEIVELRDMTFVISKGWLKERRYVVPYTDIWELVEDHVVLRRGSTQLREDDGSYEPRQTFVA
jgi:hypothetical protein